MNAKPAELHNAARAMDEMAKRVEDHGNDFHQMAMSRLADTSDQGYWSGAFADAAQKPMGDLKLAIDKAQEKLALLPPILNSHGDSMTSWQNELKQIKAEAEAAGAHIEPGPGNGVTIHWSEAAQESGMTQESADKQAKAMCQDIQRVLNEAETGEGRASTQIAQAFVGLTLDAHKVGAEYSAEVKDANKAAQLAKHLGDPPDPAKLAELQKLVAKHKGDLDGEFGTKLYSDLGGKGTVDLLNNIAVNGDGHGALQQQLGALLGQATDQKGAHHLDLHGRWMHDLLGAAKQQQTLGTNHQIYGFQSLGVAMSSGKFDKDFLSQTGTSMVQFKHDHPGAFDPQRTTDDYNHFDGKDNGCDPTNGLMKGLSHNPDAARQFLNPDVKLDGQPPTSRLHYLLNSQDPGTPGGDRSQALTLDAVASASGGHDSGVGNRIAQDAVNYLGGAEGDKPDGPPLHNDMSRESMGKVIAGQLPDVHRALGSQIGQLNSGAVSNMLGDVGKSPEAYAHLSNAAHIDAMRGMQHQAALGNRHGVISTATDLSRFSAQLDHGKAMSDVANFDQRVNAVGKVTDGVLSAVPTNAVTGPLVGASAHYLEHEAVAPYAQQAQQNLEGMYTGHHKDAAVMADQVLWQHRLHDAHPPANLMHGGHPIPFSDMNATQRQDYARWISGHNPHVVDDLQKINDAYSTDTTNADHQQGGTTDHVSTGG
ncbi:MAG: hypothetical protein J2P17_08545 [Mycobacterium sp.]|nr:hypothetical protein [Mycobacterium sp.]